MSSKGKVALNGVKESWFDHKFYDLLLVNQYFIKGFTYLRRTPPAAVLAMRCPNFKFSMAF
jgi:hypothetical protein